MANFGNRSDAITVIRSDIATLIAAYRQLITDLAAARDFDYFDTGVAAGTAPFVNGDFVGTNADYTTAAAFYADMVAVDGVTTPLTPARRKALSRLSPR